MRSHRSQNLLIDLQPGRQQLALQGLIEQMKQPQNMIRLPALIAAAGRSVETDLSPVELGGLITAMGTTNLEAQRLQSRSFSAGGVSYLDTEWPAKQESGADASEASSQRFRFLF